MEQEFTTSTGMKIFYNILAVIIIIFSLVLFGMDHSNAGQWVIAIPVALLIFAVLIIVTQAKYKIIISADSFIKIGAFGKKELPTNGIKGCRIGQKYVAIEPVTGTTTRIVINNYSDLVDSEELIKWLKENFADLDAADLKQERTVLLQDTNLGFTEKQREEQLVKAKRIAIVYNVLGSLLGFAMIFIRQSLYASILLIAYPLLGVLFMVLSKGLTKFVTNSKRSVYSFATIGIFLPAFILFIKAMGEFEISQYAHLWVPYASCGSIIFVLLYKTGVNNSLPVKGQIVLMLIVSLLYGFGAAIHINCVFDNSNPKPIQTIVNSKWIEHGKGTFYHLKLNSWDAINATKGIEVSRSTYDNYIKGDTISVDLKKGFLNIPWYYLSQQ